MDRYRKDKVVGKGSFGQAILCSRIADGKVRSRAAPAWPSGVASSKSAQGMGGERERERERERSRAYLQ